MAGPQKLNIELPYDPAIPLLGIYHKEIKTYVYSKKLVYDVHSSIIHNCQKVQTIEISMNWQLDK